MTWVDALADRDADVVVVDCLLFGVMDELTRAGRPYVVLEHLYDAYLTGGWMKGPMGWGMRLKRLHPTRALESAPAPAGHLPCRRSTRRVVAAG